MVDTVIASHFDADGRRGANSRQCSTTQATGISSRRTTDEGFFLVWDGPERNTDFTEDVYEALRQGSKGEPVYAAYHVYARLYLFQTDNVVFYQIPDRILLDFGLDLRSEPYHDAD